MKHSSNGHHRTRTPEKATGKCGLRLPHKPFAKPVSQYRPVGTLLRDSTNWRTREIASNDRG